ncbi:MAG: TetR family transcriptional regulator [Pseudomonadota bacterium]
MVRNGMTDPNPTRERLLDAARHAFWTRGYSNVALREIAGCAAVDVALIARYFGDKQGLFEATLDLAFDLSGFPEADADALVDRIVDIFVSTPRDCETPSIVRMILTNAHDPHVGALVRARHAEVLQAYLDRIIGNSERAALFMSVCLGLSVAEKSLKLDGIAPPGSPVYEAQLRHMLQAALTFTP